MFSYPRTVDCRQRFLVYYFGETSDENGAVDNCDNCQKKESTPSRIPTEAEWLILCKVLNAVVELKGRYGVHRTAKFLTGSRSLMNTGKVHRYPSYGVLRTWRQSQLIKLLNSLIASSCLRIVGDSRYPRLVISKLGQSLLDQRQAIAIDPTVFTEDTR